MPSASVSCGTLMLSFGSVPHRSSMLSYQPSPSASRALNHWRRSSATAGSYAASVDESSRRRTRAVDMTVASLALRRRVGVCGGLGLDSKSREPPGVCRACEV